MKMSIFVIIFQNINGKNRQSDDYFSSLDVSFIIFFSLSSGDNLLLGIILGFSSLKVFSSSCFTFSFGIIAVNLVVGSKLLLCHLDANLLNLGGIFGGSEQKNLLFHNNFSKNKSERLRILYTAKFGWDEQIAKLVIVEMDPPNRSIRVFWSLTKKFDVLNVKNSVFSSPQKANCCYSNLKIYKDFL